MKLDAMNLYSIHLEQRGGFLGDIIDQKPWQPCDGPALEQALLDCHIREGIPKYKPTSRGRHVANRKRKLALTCTSRNDGLRGLYCKCYNSSL